MATLDLEDVPLNWKPNGAVLLDLDWQWRQKTLGTLTNLVEGISNTDTTLIVPSLLKTFIVTSSANSPPLGQVQSTPTVVTIALGSCLVVEGEPMTVTGITGPDPTTYNYTLTVVRGTSQDTGANGTVQFPYAVPAAHAATAPVSVLMYFSLWEYLKSWLDAAGFDAVNARGRDSAIFSSKISGQLQANAS